MDSSINKHDTGDTDVESPLLADNVSKRNKKLMILNEPSALSTRRKLLIGLVIVALIACTWVGATQTAKSSYSGDFAAPFFLMWFGTASMIVVFPLTAPLYFITGRAPFSVHGFKELWKHCTEVFSPQGITFLALLRTTVLFTVIWAATNYMYSRALMNVAATDVTALFSSAPAYVFLFSICVLREPPLVLRFLSVVLCIAGIVLFAYADGFGLANVVGVALSVGSAIGAALYKVLLKWSVGEASLYQMALFLSFLGLFDILALWPILLALHFTGVELLHAIPWTLVCIGSILGILFNFSINFGIAYTFPLFISLGTILGIPINAVFDALVRGVDFLNWKFPASCLIVGGFLLMLLPPSDSLCIQRYACRRRCRRSTKQ